MPILLSLIHDSVRIASGKYTSQENKAGRQSPWFMPTTQPQCWPGAPHWAEHGASPWYLGHPYNLLLQAEIIYRYKQKMQLDSDHKRYIF